MKTTDKEIKKMDDKKSIIRFPRFFNTQAELEYHGEFFLVGSAIYLVMYKYLWKKKGDNWTKNLSLVRCKLRKSIFRKNEYFIRFSRYTVPIRKVGNKIGLRGAEISTQYQVLETQSIYLSKKRG